MAHLRALCFGVCGFLAMVLSASHVCAAEVELGVSSPILALQTEEREIEIAARLQATPCSWNAGRLTLGEAIERLSATGNDTHVSSSADLKKEAEVTAIAGNYWDGVIAVCQAFDLVLEPGEGMDVGEDSGRFSNRDNSGTAIIATGGPVRLVPRPEKRTKPIYVSCGQLLTEIAALNMHVRNGTEKSRTADIEIIFRFEPRVKALQIGTTLAAWKSVDDALGRRLEWTESAKESQGDISIVHIDNLPQPFNGATLVGELLVQALEPVSLTATMKVGDKARATLLGQEVSMELIGEGETTANGQRGPGFSLSVPTAVLGTRPTLEVMAAGQPIKFNNQGSHWSGGRIELFFRGPRQLEGEYVVTLVGQAALQQLRLPLRMPISLDSLPQGEKPLAGGMELQVPSMVEWDAGDIDLKSIIGILGNENQVLLELGADEKRSVHLPAFKGQFWEAVLVICKAFDLTLLPPSQSVQGNADEESSIATCVTGGPLCLGQRRNGRPGVEAYQANGIVMLGVDDVTVITNYGLDGISRQAEITYRLRLEPRLDASLIGSASVSWTSLGGIDDGRPLVVEESAPATQNQESDRVQMRFMRVGKRLIRVPANGNADEQTVATGIVNVTGLPTGSVDLQLHGQVSLQLRRPVRSEVNIVPGERAVAMLGDKALVLRMLDGSEEKRVNNTRRGISVEMASDKLDALNLDLRDKDGKSVRSTGSGNSGTNGRMRLMWYFAELENGPFSVILTARERMATLRLPFVLNAKSP